MLWRLSIVSCSSAPRCSGSSPWAPARLLPLPAPGGGRGLSLQPEFCTAAFPFARCSRGEASAARAGAAAFALRGRPPFCLQGRVGRAPLLLAPHSPPQRLPCGLDSAVSVGFLAGETPVRHAALRNDPFRSCSPQRTQRGVVTPGAISAGSAFPSSASPERAAGNGAAVRLLAQNKPCPLPSAAIHC